VKTVVLFDVDGTLVLTGGAGGRAMTRAFQDLFSISDAFHDIPFSGRTDASILFDALASHRIPSDAPALGSFRGRYLDHLRAELARPGPGRSVMPGIRPLLAELASRHDVYLALLTGNYEDGARLKLEHFDLWRFFRCGAFGDEAYDRNILLPLALATIEAQGGPAVAASAAVVVGDTPLDVACAAASGARCLAVATGSHTADALRTAGADIVFDDLSDTRRVLAALSIGA